MSPPRRFATVASITILGTVGIAASVWFARSVRDHGLEKTLRFLWEGDYYPPAVRQALGMLERCQVNIDAIECVVERLRITLDQSQLKASAESSMSLKEHWVVIYQPNNLQNDLAKLSHDLDHVAATIDSVVSFDEEIRALKKRLSVVVVKKMEDVDQIVATFKTL